MKRPEMKRLDKIISEFAHERGFCEKCGSDKRQIHPHHFFGRTNKSVRWDLSNIFVLCSYCHKLSPHSAHESPAEFTFWAINKRGQKWYDDLLKAKNTPRPQITFDEVMSELGDQLKP